MTPHFDFKHTCRLLDSASVHLNESLDLITEESVRIEVYKMMMDIELMVSRLGELSCEAWYGKS